MVMIRDTSYDIEPSEQELAAKALFDEKRALRLQIEFKAHPLYLKISSSTRGTVVMAPMAYEKRKADEDKVGREYDQLMAFREEARQEEGSAQRDRS